MNGRTFKDTQGSIPISDGGFQSLFLPTLCLGGKGLLHEHMSPRTIDVDRMFSMEGRGPTRGYLTISTKMFYLCYWAFCQAAEREKYNLVDYCSSGAVPLPYCCLKHVLPAFSASQGHISPEYLLAYIPFPIHV